MENINKICLRHLLPQVFANENIPASQVWLSSLDFLREGHYLLEATSGGGKSSMCAFIFGTRDDYQGSVSFNSTDIRSLSIAQWQEIRRRHIAYLPQELSLFPELSAIDNILLKNRLTDFATEAEIDSWLQQLGIENRRNYPVGRMSIGQQQRVAIIRSICQPFDFILLDEPVSHLDEYNNRIAAEIIACAARRCSAGIITTSVGNHLLLPDLIHITL